jgi:hypothetical protein
MGVAISIGWGVAIEYGRERSQRFVVKHNPAMQAPVVQPRPGYGVAGVSARRICWLAPTWTPRRVVTAAR